MELRVGKCIYCFDITIKHERHSRFKSRDPVQRSDSSVDITLVANWLGKPHSVQIDGADLNRGPFVLQAAKNAMIPWPLSDPRGASRRVPPSPTGRFHRCALSI